VGVGITKENSLKHERQTFYGEVGVPGDHSVHLALPMPTVANNVSTHPDRCLANMATDAAGKEAASPE